MIVALCAGVLGVFFLLSRQSRGLLAYAYPVAVPVLLYFLISFQRPEKGVSWFKNIVAGLAFALLGWSFALLDGLLLCWMVFCFAGMVFCFAGWSFALLGWSFALLDGLLLY